MSKAKKFIEEQKSRNLTDAQILGMLCDVSWGSVPHIEEIKARIFAGNKGYQFTDNSIIMKTGQTFYIED